MELFDKILARIAIIAGIAGLLYVTIKYPVWLVVVIALLFL